MGKLTIKRVRYTGEKYHFESPELSGGINIIEGRNGNGKSTFMNLIYYGLSGKVDEFSPSNKESHSEITQDKNNYVSLDIIINEEPFTFIRNINSNDITVLSNNANAKVFPLNRSKNEKYTFSDWILEKLQIEPVEVFQATGSSIINFRDLLRLVYHNQELNPKKVYKPADGENYIADSELIRKIIFELLVGKTFSEYYSSFAKLKEKERQRNIAKAVLDDYIASSKSISYNEDLNLIFLKKAKQDKEGQLTKLYSYRESLKNQHRPKSQFYSQINELKSQILEFELKASEKSREYAEVIDELNKLRRLHDNVIVEVTQISKIIHSHEKLSLFSADTCPYCLRDVNRENGHCVCGNEISEEQYERFFYSSDEYSDILKSKQKSIETIEVAIGSCQEQATSISKETEEIDERIKNFQEQISKWVNEYDFSSNSQEMKTADDTILQVRTDINTLTQQIEIEQRRETLLGRYNMINGEYEKLRNTVRLLEAQAGADIRTKIEEFNTTYNSLMINTLANCRSASIGFDDYMPIIDGGMYKEASASVAIRMMYFFTLLKLSLDNSDVKYPKFLLIDTPETAGVDAQNLKQAILQIGTVTSGHLSSEFQIILTTGQDKYPEQYIDNVLIRLSDENKLLKPVIGNDGALILDANN
jgi:DNA repair exonuclease SbcCD ATPase subunit